ncbi:MAG: porphobilinogen synthase [Actinomycetes bacterium]
MEYPIHRPRRLRRTAALRSLFRETAVHPGDLVLPVFVHADSGVQPVPGMPGVQRLDMDGLAAAAAEAVAVGLGGLLVFGIPDSKDPTGSSAFDPGGVVQTALGRARSEVGDDLVLIADTCLCAYTDHGHCGVLDSEGRVDNDASLDPIARTAVSQARAGADAVAPSDMMDGRVAAIRDALDSEGLTDTLVISYAVKHASAFYGPFREAAGSKPMEGDRRGYQMDPANSDEAIREALLDVAEGADVLIVKPAMPALDLIAGVRAETGAPVWGYAVSGEYAMIEAASSNGSLDRREAVLESLVAIKRSGAGTIITYHALEAAKWLRDR